MAGNGQELAKNMLKCRKGAKILQKMQRKYQRNAKHWTKDVRICKQYAKRCKICENVQKIQKKCATFLTNSKTKCKKKCKKYATEYANHGQKIAKICE